MVADDVVGPLVQSVRAFAQDTLRPLDIDREHRIPREVLTGLAELGLFGVTLPAEYGGAGLSALAATEVVAALAEHDRSVATTVGLHLGLGTRGLVAWGSRAQHERWLPGLAAGTCIGAFATTEPGAGSDLSAIASLVKERPGGGLTLTGNKIYVTNGGFASLLTITASTPGLGGAQKGTSLLLVDPKTPGVLLQPEEHKLGLRGSSTTAFIFDEVQLGHDALIGEPGHGAKQLAHVLSWGRLLLSAGTVGTARAALQKTLAHVHERVQFRRALVRLEVVQQQLAHAAARLFGMQALVRLAAHAEDDHERLARLTTSSKVFCSEGAWELCDLAVQLHGGSGYIEDTGVAVMLRDARVPRIFEGANDVLLTHAGLGELMKPTPAPAMPELQPLFDAVDARRQAIGGLRGLQQHAAQRDLGRAVMWRDATIAAHRAASSHLERAAAAHLLEEALRVAHATPFHAGPIADLVSAIVEGKLP